MGGEVDAEHVSLLKQAGLERVTSHELEARTVGDPEEVPLSWEPGLRGVC